MNKFLWVLQIFFGLYWVAIGITHYILPDGLPAAMAWMYELSPTLHLVSGSLEILGGLGLLLPGFTKRFAFLVPLAALGLAGVMVGAMIWHFQSGTFASTGPLNIVLLLVSVFIAWGRGRQVRKLRLANRA
tara:strand:- start:282 stop:674 length:393 start_codon:yes stop_codon:yes gene_type:complete